MRIALFDYKVISSNPIGSCHLQMVKALCGEHDFTVFAVEFENPHPGRIRWVKIPSPTRPLALMFIGFHILAPYNYLIHCQKNSKGFDLVQFGECNLAFGDVAYVHFCHRSYLRRHWKYSYAGGLRKHFRWLDHQFHALGEPWVYRRVHRIVVPSEGLARELQNEYPYTRPKLHVLPNPVDTDRMKRSDGFDREGMRRRMGIVEADLALIFVALGHFERKGLPMLLEALAAIDDPGIKLVVVGGEPDTVSSYEKRTKEMGLSNQVTFAGMQREIQSFLWAADAMVLPSFYEAFPLAVLEAAAAGLPLILTPLSGLEDFVRDGENSILVHRSIEGLEVGIRRFLELTPETRQHMGKKLQQETSRYSLRNFILAWREFYRQFGESRCLH
jgi:glycosyltransferase involved in cell wall biosynthesis